MPQLWLAGPILAWAWLQLAPSVPSQLPSSSINMSPHSLLYLSVPLCTFSTTSLIHQNVCPQAAEQMTGREDSSLPALSPHCFDR